MKLLTRNKAISLDDRNKPRTFDRVVSRSEKQNAASSKVNMAGMFLGYDKATGSFAAALWLVIRRRSERERPSTFFPRHVGHHRYGLIDVTGRQNICLFNPFDDCK